MLKQAHEVNVEGMDITISTGTVARQANGSVIISVGETTVFVAATAAETLRPGQDYFPLQVDYREKFSAAGRFPGGYFKREGRPSEKEILTSRLCDRPLRPLFPKGFMNEVQVVGLLLTTDLNYDSDILMINGASTALMVSDIPWDGPVGGVRIAELNGEFVTNPTHEQLFESTLDLIYVGNETAMMMIEGSAERISDERFIDALEFAQTEVTKLTTAQKELAAKCGVEKREFDLHKCDPEFLGSVKTQVQERLAEAVFQPNKIERERAVDAIKEEAEQALIENLGEDEYDSEQLRMAFELLQEDLFRENILEHGRRVDGRGPTDLREISCQAGVLPRVHGSALFQRGETQSIVICTLGTVSDNQEMDGLTGGSRSKSFILHYNFPHYSVGETGRIMGPGRREVGHGALAERSLLPIIPGEEEFPYTIRIVSEIMESNGSTSMASVCGGCLALMDAGIPITGVVAGISAGLVTERDSGGNITKHVVLTDIIGSEDHFGDMDFKISGTREGITGFQLDLKIPGLPSEIAKEAIQRNKEARCRILDIMEGEISAPRQELNQHAPRIHKMQIDQEKIGALIGPGGKTIRRITEVSGAEIDIDEDNSGKILIYATSKDALQRAIEEVEIATGDIEVGKTYRGMVRGIKEFGCFVECLPGKEGLVHVSELADFRVNQVEDVAKMGDEMWVKCIGIDERGRVRLSRRIAMAEKEGREPDDRSGESGHQSGDEREPRERGDRPRRRDDQPRRRDDGERGRGNGQGGRERRSQRNEDRPPRRRGGGRGGQPREAGSSQNREERSGDS